MENKKETLVVVGIIVIVLALLIGFGPIFVSKIMKKISKTTPEANTVTSNLFLQAKGKLTIVKDGILLLTNEKNDKYILVGLKADELKNYTDKTIEVYGRMKVAEPKEINNEPVRCNIEVIKYGSLIPATEGMNQKQIEALQKKVEKKRKLSDEILSKLNKKKIFEVLKGKVELKYPNVPEVGYVECLVLETEDSDKYNLLGPAAVAVLKDFKYYKNKTLIVIGNSSLPSSGIFLEKDIIPFMVDDIYYENLKPIPR